MDSNQTHQTAATEAQDAQYGYPYHYLPVMSEEGFIQHRYWSWGYRYLGRLKVVFDLLRGIEFNSLLDIGCGDGRFLREIHTLYGNKKLTGIDISEKAIGLANQMNPELNFERRDIVTEPLSSRWDVVTLLEVIEHIRQESLPNFMRAAAKLLRPGGSIIITAPHVNEKRITKHHQHFDQQKLRNLLAPDFDECSCVFFDHISLVMRAFVKVMGGAGMFYIVTHRGLNNLLYKYYMKNCLYGEGEKRCRRIALMARRKRQPQP